MTSYTFKPAQGETLREADPYRPKPHVSYGLPFTEACAHHAVNTFHAKRIYIVISGSISRTPEWPALQDALKSQGCEIVGITADGIAPHTPWHQVYTLTRALIDTKPDLILAVGGGSITDGVKLARLFAPNGVTNDKDRLKLWEVIKPDVEREKRTGKTDADESVKPADIPIINVTTTLSGGEWTHYSGATDESNHKSLFGHSSMLTDLVVYDTALTLPVPERFWISTGVRAIDHLVEGLASVQEPPPGWDAEAVRQQFEDALRMILPSLFITKKDPKDLDARLGSLLATIPCPKAIQMGIGASHGIGHQLGPLGVGHGETSCILSPNVLKYNGKHGSELVRSRQERIKAAFWKEPAVAEVLKARGLEQDGSDAGDAFDAYLRELGMPRSLKSFGIRKDQFGALAEGSLRDIATQMNPVKLDKERVIEILEMAYESWDER
jgi:alcohol dehydrogenase class IV